MTSPLVSPDDLIRALQMEAFIHMDDDTGEICERAARMIWRLWLVAEPEEAAKAKPRLFGPPVAPTGEAQ